MDPARDTSARETLIERYDDWRTGMTVERTTLLITGIALAGLTSRNGYAYSEQALRDAAPLYNGKPVFLDHAPHNPRGRSTRDLAGTVLNPRFEGNRLRGDVQALDTDAGRTLLALAERETQGVGMSQVVMAERKGDQVNRIHDVVSVDVVIGPATTSTFREQTEPPAGELQQLRDQVARLTQLVEQRIAPTSHARTAPTGPQTTDQQYIAALRG